MTWQVSRFRIGLLSDSNLVESQIFALWEKRKRIIGKCFEISNWNVALGYLDFSNKEKFLELEGGTLFLNRRKGSLIFCSRRKINLFEADIVADSKDENFKGNWSKNLASGRDLHRWGGLKNISLLRDYLQDYLQSSRWNGKEISGQRRFYISSNADMHHFFPRDFLRAKA